MKSSEPFVMGKYVLSASLEFAQASQLSACIQMLKSMAEVTQAKLTTTSHYLDAERVTSLTGPTSESTMSTGYMGSVPGSTNAGQID